MSLDCKRYPIRRVRSLGIRDNVMVSSLVGVICLGNRIRLMAEIESCLLLKPRETPASGWASEFTVVANEAGLAFITAMSRLFSPATGPRVPSDT